METVLVGMVVVGVFVVKWVVIGWVFSLIIGALKGLGRIGTTPDMTTEVVSETEEEETQVEEEEEEEGVDVDVLHMILNSVENNDDDNVIDFATRKKIRDIRSEINALGRVSG